jgi:hypothetical protein
MKRRGEGSSAKMAVALGELIGKKGVCSLSPLHSLCGLGWRLWARERERERERSERERRRRRERESFWVTVSLLASYI